jgi:hypothetical protein
MRRRRREHRVVPGPVVRVPEPEPRPELSRVEMLALKQNQISMFEGMACAEGE